MKQLAKWCEYVIIIKVKNYILGGLNARIFSGFVKKTVW